MHQQIKRGVKRGGKRYVGLFILVLLSLGGCRSRPQAILTIAAASNMQFVLEPLTQAFSQETGISCQKLLSSSGKLTAQIKAGAPYDVFLSADLKYPQSLDQAGLTQQSPQVYAYGELVLWSAKPGIRPSLEELKLERIRKIAIANPKTAPYGIAAIESLEHHGLLQPMQNKLVYGESIGQVSQMIESQTVDLGFTAKSVVVSPQLKGTGQWITVNPKSYRPLAHGIVILKRSPHLTQAQSFQDFLLSQRGQDILKRYGYQPQQP